MKSLFLVAAAAVSLFFVPQAPAEVTGGDVANAALRIGARLLESQLEKRRAAAEEKAAAAQSAEAPAAVAEERPSASERVSDKLKRGAGAALGTLVNGVGEHLVAEPISDWLPRLLREMADKVVNEFKEQYKQEGREYARELGTLVTERVLASKRIRSTLITVKILCWSVVAYLSVISIIIFFWLWRVKSRTERLFKLCEELLREKSAEKKA